MAHFAEVDNNNKVIQVVVVNNNVLLNENNEEDSSKGIDFLTELYGPGRVWIQASYNENTRLTFPGEGFNYDSFADVFYAPQPYPSWILDSSYKWSAPVERPVDRPGFDWRWNETFKKWVEVSLEPNV